jgi:TP901 family phage tail tape measure protein
VGSEVFQLAILISLRDAASQGADRVSDRLRSMGRDGKVALKTFEDLRKDLRQGLVIGGIGTAGLAGLWKGAKVAGDFESAITELRLSIEETGRDGSVNLEKLGDRMNRLESLSVRLGNQLPGTTQDFIEMFTSLKKGGLDVETILGGAGEQVAYLSVLTNSLPKDLAKDFAALGLQFQLKPEDFAPSTDKFLKMYRAVGLHPSQLIEGTKFAELRAGLPLGLKGMKGLDVMSTLLASLAAVGLEGGIGGRELGGLMLSLVPHGKEQMKADAMLRSKGIKLDFFDKKGQFIGEKGFIEQLAQLKKLNPEQRQAILKQRFNEAALGPISALSERGVEGYELLQKKMAAVPNIQDQINEKMATFNAKMESLEGTIDNLKATTFSPMLDTLKPALDLANQFVGNLQEFGKDHPGIAKLATEVFGVGSATLVVVGGVKSMTAAWKLWRIASSVSSEEKLIEFLKRVRTETDKTTAGIGLGAEKAVPAAKRAGGRVGNAFTSAIKIAVMGFGIDAVITELMEKGYQAIESRKAQADITDLLKERDSIEGQMRNSKIPMWEGTDKIKEIDAKIGELRVNASNASRTRDSVSLFADPSKFAADVAKATNPYSDLRRGPWRSTFEFFTNPFTRLPQSPSQQRSEADKPLREDLRGMRFTSKEDLGAFLDTLRKGGQYTSQELENINRLATVEYPGFMKSLNELKTTTQQTTGSLGDFKAYLDSTRPNLNGLFTGNTNQPNGGSGNTVPPAKPSAPVRKLKIPKGATGGYIEREGLIHIHSGERIIPAAQIRRDANTASSVRASREGGITLKFYIAKDSPAAKSPRALAAEVVHEVRRQRERR